MKKRFVVLVNGPTPKENETFIEYAKSKGLGWWYWLDGSFLLMSPNTTISAGDLRDMARTIFNDKYNLIIELTDNGDTWSGFGAKTEEKNMFDWIHQNWTKK